MHESCPLNGLMHCLISVLAQIILPEAEQGRLTMAGRVPRAIRLSQHLDMEGQLEVLQLKAKLQEMTEMVQQLLQHLNLLEKMPGLFSKESPKKGSVATQTSGVPNEFQWENPAAIREKMKELVDMNLNWQKYNALQEKHIHELNEKVEALTLKSQSPNFSRQDQPDEQLKQIEELHRENLQLKSKVRQLTSQLGNSLSLLDKEKFAEPGCLEGTCESDQLMAAQLMVFKEDFELERRDREKAQAKISELEYELQKLKKHLTEQKFTPGFRNEVNPVANSDEPKAHNTIYENDDLALDAADAPISNQVLPQHGVKNPMDKMGVRSRVELGVREDVLCCPKCFKVFTKLEHYELLDHIEQCHGLNNKSVLP